MTGSLRVDVLSDCRLRFDDGAPVRAASGITPFEDGWLVVSDDAVHAALWTDAGISRVRVLPTVEGHDVFAESSGTKHLKPDLEAACRVTIDGTPSALLLGSGSLRGRMRAVLVEEHTRNRQHADLHGLYRRVAAVLDIPPRRLNMEGACVVAGALRWFQRGNVHLDMPSASVDVDLSALVAAIRGEVPIEAVPITAPQVYAMGTGDDSVLAVTDALAIPGDQVLLAVASEATANAVDDGLVTDAALMLLDGQRVLASARLPHGLRGPRKVEGLALVRAAGSTVHVMAVSDADDPTTPSQALELVIGLP